MITIGRIRRRDSSKPTAAGQRVWRPSDRQVSQTGASGAGTAANRQQQINVNEEQAIDRQVSQTGASGAGTAAGRSSTKAGAATEIHTWLFPAITSRPEFLPRFRLTFSSCLSTLACSDWTARAARAAFFRASSSFLVAVASRCRCTSWAV